MLVGGISFLLLALFYFVIDVKGYRGWTLFFRIIGMNSIAIYMAVRIVNFKPISAFFFGGIANQVGDAGPIVLAIGVIIVQWCLSYFLYRKKKIF